MQRSHYPVIVIGGGTMGLAAAWELGKRDTPALVLEQFGIVHDLGSHSGQTRIIRHAYAESPDYVPLVRRADDLFVALEEETGASVLYRTGGLDLAGPGHGHARAARESAERWDVPFEWLDGAEVRHRFPAWRVPDDWEACYSPKSGFLHVDATLSALASAATERGVVIRERTPVHGWRVDSDAVVVETQHEIFTADKLIVTAGAWSSRLLAEIGLPLTVLRKVLWWFGVEDTALYHRDRFPVYIAESDAGHVYGFPLDAARFGEGLKIAEHSGGDPTDPEDIDRVARDEEAGPVLDFARHHLTGVTDQIERRAVCMYTMTPDSDFIVDRHPDHAQVVFGTGFSGHGFKFATAIGEHLANLVLDPDTKPYTHLALERLQGAARS
ncbi:MAG TPA: N-methyl-L-tryptophan oxidase [Thermomicrobiales bacterium]|nr:N-methyl-L-tryptophan oxidase [Thermomicrobiales bacterium]